MGQCQGGALSLRQLARSWYTGGICRTPGLSCTHTRHKPTLCTCRNMGQSSEEKEAFQAERSFARDPRMHGMFPW